MPRVPTYQPGQVKAVQATTARLKAPDAPNGLGLLAEGLKGVAGLANQQDKINFENDETQARLALSTGRQQVAGQVDSFKGLQLGQARAGQEGFNTGLDKIKTDLLATAKTTRQRQMIEQGWIDIDAPARRMGASWALSQAREETKLSFGTEQTALIDSAVSSDDPQFRDHVGLQVRDNVRRRLEFEGYDLKQNPQVLAVEEKAALSKLHAGMGDRMFSTNEPDIPAIGEYVTAYGDEMTADVRNDFLKRLQGPLQGRMAKADADHFMGLAGPPPEATKPSSRSGVANLDAITIQSESGGNPNAVSPVGARGLMQVMPATARDPGFGIRPSDGSQQDDVRVGKAYRAKMEQRYGGDLAKMWAAYNWGPGALDNAIKKHGDNWLDHAPAETKAYVRKNIAAVGSSGAAYQPAPQEIDRGGAYNALNRAVEAGEISPERADRARLEIDRRTRVNESLLNDQRQRADDQAKVIALNAGDNFRVSMLPKAVRDNLSPVDLAEYAAAERRIAEQRAKAAETARKEAARETGKSAEWQLEAQARFDPEGFKRVDLKKYIGVVSGETLNSLAVKQVDLIRKPPPKFQPQEAISGAISRGQKYHGVKVDDKDMPAIYDFMQDKLAAVQAKNGGIGPNDADEAFKAATSVAIKRPGMIWGSTERKGYEVTVDDIGAGLKDTIRRSWKGSKPPTDDQILDVYRAMVPAKGL